MGEPAPISLDTLTEQQQEALASARLIAKEAGWKLDEFSEWTLLRFLLKHRHTCTVPRQLLPPAHLPLAP